MARPRPRYTDYGAPLPELADARQEVLYDRAQNQTQRRLLQQLLELMGRDLLRRGVFARVTCEWTIDDGVIQDEVDTIIKQHWKRLG